MKRPTKRILWIVLCAGALLVLADELPALRFRGDGHFTGGPVFGYWIRLKPIPFYKAGEYVFHFRGMPSEEMSLQLYAEGKEDNNRSELTNLDTRLEAILVDQKGRTACHAAGIVPTEHDPCKDCGVPKQKDVEARFQKEWVLMSGSGVAAYWHADCLSMRFSPFNSYTLTLRIQSVDPRTPKINLVPVLKGGQLDLP